MLIVHCMSKDFWQPLQTTFNHAGMVSVLNFNFNIGKQKTAFFLKERNLIWGQKRFVATDRQIII